MNSNHELTTQKKSNTVEVNVKESEDAHESEKGSVHTQIRD